MNRRIFLGSLGALAALAGLRGEEALAFQSAAPPTFLSYGPAAQTLSRTTGITSVAWIVHRKGDGWILTPFDANVPGSPVYGEDLSSLPRLRELTTGYKFIRRPADSLTMYEPIA